MKTGERGTERKKRMSKYHAIYEEPEWTKASSMIKMLDIPSRQKSSIKYMWKKKNKQADTTTINDVAPKEKDDNTIWDEGGDHRSVYADLVKRISVLEDEFKMLKSGVNLSVKEQRECEQGRCCLCGKDPEGYDLPCTHEICHACFKSRLIETKITCTICQETFSYDYVLE